MRKAMSAVDGVKIGRDHIGDSFHAKKYRDLGFLLGCRDFKCHRFFFLRGLRQIYYILNSIRSCFLPLSVTLHSSFRFFSFLMPSRLPFHPLFLLAVRAFALGIFREVASKDIIKRCIYKTASLSIAREQKNCESISGEE